jgi:hypothetical protein
MTIGRRPPTQPNRSPYGSGGGPPAWLVFVLGVALVLGGYYLFSGFRNFVQRETRELRATEQQQAIVVSATAVRLGTQTQAAVDMPPITVTTVPECQPFVVIVESALVRQEASTSSPQITAFQEGDSICVLEAVADGEWYKIDIDQATRRIETGYMFYNIIEAVNPTPTPSSTFTPLPTTTPAPTLTPTTTPSPEPSPTRDPDASNTPTPTPTPTPSTAAQSA